MTRRGEILVVDDDPDIRSYLRVVLESNGYTVRTAVNGGDAMKELESGRPDLIILDMIMTTETEGYDVACKIKGNPRLADVPIIVLTCFLEKIREEGEMGKFKSLMGEEWPARWLFEKPVETKKLLERIRGILSGD